jgi:hypothetical protein
MIRATTRTNARLVRPALLGAFVALLLLVTLAAPFSAAPLAPRGDPGGAVGALASCPSNPNPNSTLSIATNVSLGPAPLAVDFCLYSILTVTAVAWNFGDGTNASGPAVTHVFTVEGAYDVQANVTYSGGTLGSGSVWIYATGPATQPIQVNSTVNVSSGRAPLDVTVTTSVSGCRGICSLNVTSATGPLTAYGANQIVSGSPVVNYLVVPSAGIWVVHVYTTDPLGDAGTASFQDRKSVV